MRAVQFSSFGAPHAVADVVELPEPGEPGSGQVTVALEAAPINPADLLNLQGKYGVVPTLPSIGGFEGVGRVTAVGQGVTHLRVGNRVLVGGGTWCERFTLPAGGLFALPGNVPAEQLAMLTINPLTARAMLQEAALAPGDFIIKNAANSGVGRVLFGLAKKAGVQGIAVVRRPGLEDMLKEWGAAHVVVDGPDLAQRVRAIVGAGKLRHGIDAIGGAATGRIAACLGGGGTVVNYGLLSGEACQVSGGDLVFRGIQLRGFWVGRWLQVTPREEIAAAFADLAGLLAAGELTTPVEATYPLSQVREALQHAAREGRDGKVVLRPD